LLFCDIASLLAVDHVTESYRPSAKFLLALTAVLAAAWIVYTPGLHGGFLFDDFANLPVLGNTGPVDNWPAFWRYITSGMADPLGRPLALLSFLRDAHDWPAAPFPFKRSNLILHLLNGVLLALMLRRMGHALASRNGSRNVVSAFRLDMAAAVGAGFWLLHPLLVSTTLYIVQREAMLSSTFTLLGLLAWLRGRHAVYSGRTTRGLCWMALGLGGCTLLSILSKANGVLLPALAVVIESTVMAASSLSTVPCDSTNRNRGIYRYAMLVMGWLPSAFVASYLIYQGWHGLTQGISSVRPWTLGQRLLTEPRVLMDYLQLLWLPRPFTPGLFNDQIHASTSLWSPVTTLLSMLAVAALIIAAWICRLRYPAWALAILFYFVGQSLESSSVPLELYFEHRNYLPAMLMFWPLALFLCGTGSRSLLFTNANKGRRIGKLGGNVPNSRLAQVVPSNWPTPSNPEGIWPVIKLMIAVVLFLGLGFMTYARASLWGNTRDQTQLWATLNPDSPRAQADVANSEINSGHPSLAVARLEPALENAPAQAQLAMNLFNAQCRLGQVTPAMILKFKTALRTTRDVGPLLVHWFSDKMDQIGKPDCPELTLGTLDSLLSAAATNPNLNSIYGRRQDMDFLRGRMALLHGDANTALFEFNRALDEDAQISMALQQAALLGSSGFPRQGLAHLDHYERVKKDAAKTSMGMPSIHAWVLEREHYWPDELAHLRDTLNKDAVHQAITIHESCTPREKSCGQ
jgi:hypothetical protein